MATPDNTVGYDFYVGQYLGDRMGEKTFCELARRAQQELDRIKRVYTVKPYSEQAHAMAICAMAETLHAASARQSGVSSASIGKVSVRYESAAVKENELRRELYRQASVYLDICRGVGA